MRTPSRPSCPANVAPSCSISLRLSPSPSRPHPQNLRLAEGCAIALVILAYLWVEGHADPTPTPTPARGSRLAPQITRSPAAVALTFREARSPLGQARVDRRRREPGGAVEH